MFRCTSVPRLVGALFGDAGTRSLRLGPGTPIESEHAASFGFVAFPRETIEDEVKPELELIAVVVFRLEGVLDDQLGEVGVFLGREQPEDHVGHIGSRFGAVERQACFLLRKTTDVVVENRERVRGHIDREASFPKASDHGVEVAIVAGSVQISAKGKVIRVHQIRHDRQKEHGAFATPQGRPRRQRSA
jgi:hypothetical protein